MRSPGINPKQRKVQADFDIPGDRIRSISPDCRKSIGLYESRKPVTNYSFNYRRLFELEVCLLEKE
ncbi:MULTISPECIES: hypothetical protein [unclassified Microcoleus]|uniref:hypothetical protein n=1 Tax=unclassified Microcoleus TaxID=2642155 RepID=UPI0025D6F2FE|nr:MULTISPECIES: hypothetical protein [unclassified Microcoleus]